MFELTKLLSAIILPPFSILLIWLCSLLLLKLRYVKSSYIIATIGCIFFYVVSIPYTTEKLNNSLVNEDRLSLQDYQQAQAIVVLGGGLRDSQELFAHIALPALVLERLRYASYLYQQTHLPILVTGGAPNGNSEAKFMAQELQRFFHTPTKWLENHAQNTQQNALFSAQILLPEKINRIILVTQEWHMQRAKKLFEQQGFSVLPASVGHGKIPSSYSLSYMHFIPQASALNANAQLIKEWLGYWKTKA